MYVENKIKRKIMNFSEAVIFFRDCRDELSVKIRGGLYEHPITHISKNYEGINCEKKLEEVIKKSTDVKTSFISIREGEMYLNRIHEIRYDAQLIKVELKALIENKSLIKDSRYSDISRDLKEILNKVNDYYEICDMKYKHILEVLWGLVQINASINKRYFRTSEFMYDYDADKQ